MNQRIITAEDIAEATGQDVETIKHGMERIGNHQQEAARSASKD